MLRASWSTFVASKSIARGLLRPPQLSASIVLLLPPVGRGIDGDAYDRDERVGVKSEDDTPSRGSHILLLLLLLLLLPQLLLELLLLLLLAITGPSTPQLESHW